MISIPRWLLKLFPKWRVRPRDRITDLDAEMRSAARRRGRFFVYTDFVDAYEVDPDGRCYRVEGLQPPKLVNAPEEQHRLRWLAADRYRELEHLRPVRAERDVECPGCRGSGRPLLEGPESDGVCWCGGAGWLPGPRGGDS